MNKDTLYLLGGVVLALILAGTRGSETEEATEPENKGDANAEAVKPIMDAVEGLRDEFGSLKRDVEKSKRRRPVKRRPRPPRRVRTKSTDDKSSSNSNEEKESEES